MIPVVDATTATIATTVIIVIIATIITTTNPAITMMSIGMIPITADRINMRIAEMTPARHGVLLIVQETAFIKRELVMTKDALGTLALAIHLYRRPL